MESGKNRIQIETEVNTMSQEKRKHARISSLNLSYICLDENEKIVKQGMGRTLNVSESGMLLETHLPVDTKHMVMLTIGLEEDIIELRGKPVHSKKNDRDLYEVGIKFQESDASVKKTLKKFIKAFNNKKD
jgi:c-di-GMP-binding flagellar brake protein YcgR